ncbi:hypothetical protein WA026_001764 [Henosepilachna vigintioctopunctata]|uniref:Uncharacterized protein n=1 Tax=Henosepilachna vigintioctopunctata TaxID=420089 RepID=A0AAW1UJ71_9CUCU
MECSKCKKVGFSKTSSRTLFECDQCNAAFFANCSDSSALEVKVVQLQRRKLIFYCPNCVHLVNDVGVLMSQVRELTGINDLLWKEIEDLTNANLDIEKILKENDHLKKLNECLERKIEFNDRNYIQSNLKREDITYKANSNVEQKLFETQRLQALESENVYLKKLFEESNDKN